MKYSILKGGDFYKIAESGEMVYIVSGFTGEFSGSNDTARLKGMLAKAKANAAQTDEGV